MSFRRHYISNCLVSLIKDYCTICAKRHLFSVNSLSRWTRLLSYRKGKLLRLLTVKLYARLSAIYIRRIDILFRLIIKHMYVVYRPSSVADVGSLTFGFCTSVERIVLPSYCALKSAWRSCIEGGNGQTGVSGLSQSSPSCRDGGLMHDSRITRLTVSE